MESMSLTARSGSIDENDILSPRYNTALGQSEISLTRRSMDALGLVMGAGTSKTVEVHTTCSLHIFILSSSLCILFL